MIRPNILLISVDQHRADCFGKAHFSTYHTFEKTGTPVCLKSSADYPDTWNGPYMGFDHVELMLIGYNWWALEKPPGGQHYERWFHADGRGDEEINAMRENAGDTKCAACEALLNMDGRLHD